MKVYANDTFCLYAGLALVFIGVFFVWLSPFIAETYTIRTTLDVALSGFATIALGISIQLMSFQRQPEDKE